MVQVLSGYGIPQEKIAVLTINPTTGIGISEHTLRKAFSNEIAAGLAQAQVQVVGALHKNAVISNNVAAQIFLCKTRYGYREKDSMKVDVTVKDGDENSMIEKARRVAFMLAQGARAARSMKKP